MLMFTIYCVFNFYVNYRLRSRHSTFGIKAEVVKKGFNFSVVKAKNEKKGQLVKIILLLLARYNR